ncbi:hypothetical protein Q3G72_020437 [Acer saccharum]|nr:hypothetical protein Q3G72_020437 [Acer saccharum]
MMVMMVVSNTPLQKVKQNLLHQTPAPQITLLICFICSTKRLPPTPAVDSTHESENSSIGSPAMSSELEQQQGRSMPSPDQLTQSSVMELRSPAPETATPAETQSKLTLPLLSPELAAS